MGETQQYILKAMAHNYSGGHSWDDLDGEACEKAAAEIAEKDSTIAAVTAERDGTAGTLADMAKDLARVSQRAISAEARIAVLEKALAFYADKEMWVHPKLQGPCTTETAWGKIEFAAPAGRSLAGALKDHGDIARAALGAGQPSLVEAEGGNEAEHFIQAAIDHAPEPLRRLGEYLTKVLDDDQWKTAEGMLLALTPERIEAKASEGGK